MKESSADRLEGKAREMKGRVKQAAGDLADREDLKARGAAEKTGGKVQRKVGEVKKVFGK